jgi:nucleoid-associated protein YgaU
MTDAGRRLVGAGCFLAGLWVLVYWLWQPVRPTVSFAGEGEVAEPKPAPREASRGDDGPRGPQPVRDPLEIDQGSTTSSSPVSSPPPAALSPGPDLSQPPPGVPLFRDYTIREGDTFEAVALRELGSRRLADAIARANPLKDPRRLREGDVIRLPLDPANIQGGPPATPGQEVAPVREAVEAGWVTYTVEDGDTLSAISQLFYGTVRHANLIFEANRDQLRSVNSVRAGQVIRIPPRPE